MARAPFQVIVIPCRLSADGYQYALFKRRSAPYWQAISGGGEGDEVPIEAARRETLEEAGVGLGARFLTLESQCHVPVVNVVGFQWGEDVLLLKEFSFGVELGLDEAIILSDEHCEYRWCSYEEGRDLVRFDSNRTALWELDYRLRRGLFSR